MSRKLTVRGPGLPFEQPVFLSTSSIQSNGHDKLCAASFSLPRHGHLHNFEARFPLKRPLQYIYNPAAGSSRFSTMFFKDAIPLIREYSIKAAIALFLFVIIYVYRAARRPVIIAGSAYLGFVYFSPIWRFLVWAIKGIAMSTFYLHFFFMGIGYITLFLSNVFQGALAQPF